MTTDLERAYENRAMGRDHTIDAFVTDGPAPAPLPKVRRGRRKLVQTSIAVVGSGDARA